jgi:hypothetical protein
MKTTYEFAESIWHETQLKLANRSWQKRLSSGDGLTVNHYKGFLIETYHNAGLNPQLQGYATFFTEERPRDAFKKFFQHAISELGHDLLALDDLENLGVERSLVLNSKPLPETKAFYSNTVVNTQKMGIPAYLAYLFHLEYTPTTQGPSILSMLKSKGIPENALSFLHEHSTVDIQHLKLMKTYMDSFVSTTKDKEVFAQCLHECSVLHQRVLEAAFENGEVLFARIAA